VVVLSLWRGGTCVGTFRLAREELPDLVAALTKAAVAQEPA
jgi:hypothetical protein